MHKTKIFLTYSLFQLFLASLSHAQIYDHDYIENFAKQQLESKLSTSSEKQISVSVTNIDPRINIKPCLSKLIANIPQKHNSRNVNIEITCDSSNPWSLFIPARIQVKSPVVVALSAIDKGSTLTSDNIGVKFIDEKKIRGERLSSIASLIGAKSKRNLLQGSAVTRRNICIVCKGDSVVIEAHSSSLSIKTKGVSLMSGHLGDKVKVKNERSGRLVSAHIVGLNKVRINL